MIRRVDTAGRASFLAAVRGKAYFGDVMPLHLAVFGENHPHMQFYTASPNAALQVHGRSALLCGTYNREETGGFCALCGVERVLADGAPPAGYVRERRLCYMVFSGADAKAGEGSGAGDASVGAGELRKPPPAGLVLDKAPPPGETADFLMRGKGGELRDNFYAELCMKLARGAACVWAVRGARDGRMCATAGAYALTPKTAYLAAVETAGPLRGKGIGSWLVAALAAQLAAEGRRVSLHCEEGRAAFYARLGFAQAHAVWRYGRGEEAAEEGLEQAAEQVLKQAPEEGLERDPE